MNEISMTWLKDVRASRNETINSVSIATGLTDSKISHIETGKTHQPKIHDLLLLASYYQIDTVDLFIRCGYLSREEINIQTNFKHSSLLNANEISLVQQLIDQLLINRGEKI